MVAFCGKDPVHAVFALKCRQRRSHTGPIGMALVPTFVRPRQRQRGQTAPRGVVPRTGTPPAGTVGKACADVQSGPA